MAIKSSVHIKSCNTKSSEAHNRRTAEYMRNIGESKIYIVSELSADNEQWINPELRQPKPANALRQHQTDGKGKDRSCHAGERA